MGLFWGWVLDGEMIGWWCKKVDKLGIVKCGRWGCGYFG